MPVENISGLIQNLSDQLSGPAPNSNVQKGLLGQASSVTPAVVEDTFTPSAQNGSALTPAQDASLFQFAPRTLTANQNNAANPPTHRAIPLLGPAQGVATTDPGANRLAAQPQTTPPGVPATNSVASTAKVQLQIQSLNAALPALGLSNTEINQIDRIATLVQNFNPAAYANLVSQFEALAQNSGSATPANALLLPNASGSNSSGNSASTVGFQVQGISLQFTGSTQAGNSSFAGGGGKNTDGSSPQSNSAGVQIAKVQFTLVNGNGQTAQIQTP
jgi:hypothetical protein